MKKYFLKLTLLALCTGSILFADAQRRGRSTRPADPAAAGQNGQSNNSQPATQQQVNNNQPSGYNPYGNIPIEAAPVSAGGFNDTIKRSLRQDGAYEKSMNDRTPLTYDYLRPDDALYTERVWREIDTREKINQVFNYQMDDNNGNQRFINIMVDAIRNRKVVAFSSDDDRFTTPLDSAQFEKVLSGGNQCDTVPVYNINDPTKIDKYVVNCSQMNPDDVVKFRLKEDWVFDRESSRMVCRIIGIAPLKVIMSADGKREMGATPLFWVYYPDMRPVFVKYEVYNPKNMGNSRMTWEELFESRMFSSYIVKSTLDNPGNKNIKNVIKDPILALLEGDNIKEKIFNFEQDLWSY